MSDFKFKKLIKAPKRTFVKFSDDKNYIYCLVLYFAVFTHKDEPGHCFYEPVTFDDFFDGNSTEFMATSNISNYEDIVTFSKKEYKEWKKRNKTTTN